MVSGLAIAAFALAFAAGHATGPAHAAPPTLRPLRASSGALVLPHLSQVPALPTLAAPAPAPAPAPKPKPVVVTPRVAPAPPARQPRPKPKPKVTAPKAKVTAPNARHVTRPAAAAKRPPRPAAPKPVVIVGSG